MSSSKKSLDTPKRQVKKSELRPRKHQRAVHKKIGRPEIDQQQLFPDRDSLLQVLIDNWERIGWRLSQARSSEALRKALRPLKREPSLSHRIALFLRTCVEQATPSQVRVTTKTLGKEVENNYAIQERYNLLTQKYDGADVACNFATQGLGNTLVLAEFNKRAHEFEECERERFASNCKLADLEVKLADQQAFLMQTQVLKFKARGYAHNPKVFANAMAGLPIIGCRHSFRICSRKSSPLWPSNRFKVFEFVQRAWKNRADSKQPRVHQFREQILQLPRTVRVDREIVLRYKLKSNFQDNYLRGFLCENWRFLRLAIEQVSVHRVDVRVVPYLITSRLYINCAKSRSSEEVILAEIEMLRDMSD